MEFIIVCGLFYMLYFAVISVIDDFIKENMLLYLKRHLLNKYFSLLFCNLIWLHGIIYVMY